MPCHWNSTEAAAAWGVSRRQAQELMKRIRGAVKHGGRDWLIPEGTPRPAKLRAGPKRKPKGDLCT